MLNINLGLPTDLKSSCFWVERKFRKNDLSFISGGCDIVLSFADGTVFRYDWIKYPSKFILRIIHNQIIKSRNVRPTTSPSLDDVKNTVQKVFARKYSKDKYEQVPFEEVWNSQSSSFPWELLPPYTFEVYKSFLEFFKNNVKIARQYLSIWFPFTHLEVIKYWDLFELGSAHYCTYISDIEWIFPAKLGLSFNQKIRWNSKMRSKWNYGFNNPYFGYVDGTGKEPVEFDEAGFLDIISPLQIEKEYSMIDQCVIQHASSLEQVEAHFEKTEKTRGEFPFLNLNELSTIVLNTPYVFLSNKSIWEVTMSKMVDTDFCGEIFYDSNNS